MSLIDNLNPQQRDAVTNTDGAVLVLAGAGSGKTRVLTHKVAYLLEQGKAREWEILAVTFTNKAAGEMKNRIQLLLRKELPQMWVGTFHAIFARLLRRHCELIGYNPNFVIYDREDQLKVAKEVLHSLPNIEALINPKRAVNIISSVKSGLRELINVGKEGYFKFDSKMLFDAYEKKLKAYGACDFDDLLIKPLELMREHPEIAEIYQNKLRYILVDEFQDTNVVQNELLKLLWIKHKNITVVGDDDQSIYGWRGAEITNILNFPKNFAPAKIFRLERNYRSSQAILKAAQSVIEHNFNRHGKELWTDKKDPHKPLLITAANEQDEANTIARLVLDLNSIGINRSEIGVLYRTNAQSRSLEGAFRDYSIPYTIVGGLKFYQRKEIKDLLAYLKLTLNPQDSISLLRIINFPPRGIGSKTISKLVELSENAGISLWEVLQHSEEYDELSGSPAKKLDKFCFLIKDIHEYSQNSTFLKLVKRTLEKSGMVDYYELEGDEEALSRKDNLQEFIAGVEEYVKNYPDRTIEDFLQEAALVQDVDEWEEGDLVNLMTVHCAKGLEFNAVFITGLEEGLFPLIRDDHPNIEEERRLFYVGATRAKERLYLSCAAIRREGFGSALSRFVEEIPPALIDSYHKGRTLNLGKRSAALSSKAKSWDSSDTSPPLIKSFHRGDQVEHYKFGLGMVAGSEIRGGDELVTVFFQGYGAKKLVARVAGLKKV